MKKIGQRLDVNLELLEFFKVYKRTKAYCLLLRDEQQFRSMRKGLNSSYGKLTEICSSTIPKSSLALHLKLYTDAIQDELLVNKLRSDVYKNSEESVFLDLNMEKDREIFKHRVKNLGFSEVISEAKFYHLFE